MYTPSVSVLDLIQAGHDDLLDGTAVYSCNRIPVAYIVPKRKRSARDGGGDCAREKSAHVYHSCFACNANLKNAAMYCSLKCARDWQWRRKTARKPDTPPRSFVF